jgi:ferrous-iron efflux pump FieF
MRPSGPNTFIDLHILVKSNAHLDQVHTIMDKVEAAVQKRVPRSDVTVHPEPKKE